MKNSLVVTGTLKNIKTFANPGSEPLVTAWFDQREVSRMSDGTADRRVYVMGIQIVARDSQDMETLQQLDNARQGSDYTPLVTLSGRMVTKFDRRLGIKEADKRAPQLQLAVEKVELYSIKG